MPAHPRQPGSRRLEGVAIKQWVGDHSGLAGLDAAFRACDPNPPQTDKADAAAPEELLACLRNKGLDAPTNVEAIKPWIIEQSQTDAGQAALTACGFGGVEEKRRVPDGGAYGAAKAGASDRAKASRAGTARVQTAPTT